MTIEDFMDLDDIPRIWKNVFFMEVDHGAWILPKYFRIVLGDDKWISYEYLWSKPSCSEWRYHCLYTKPFKRYKCSSIKN